MERVQPRVVLRAPIRETEWFSRGAGMVQTSDGFASQFRHAAGRETQEQRESEHGNDETALDVSFHDSAQIKKPMLRFESGGSIKIPRLRQIIHEDRIDPAMCAPLLEPRPHKLPAPNDILMREDLPNDRLMRLEKELAHYKAEAERLRAELERCQEEMKQSEHTGGNPASDAEESLG